MREEEFHDLVLKALGRIEQRLEKMEGDEFAKRLIQLFLEMPFEEQDQASYLKRKREATK